MKFSQKYRIACRAGLALVIFAIGLTACSSGNESSSDGSGGKQASGPTTGRLIDAVVSGVAYSTSSKKAGTTDEDGIYNYNHGDTVEFKLGSLTLGKVKATAIVTPINLAGDSNNRLQNLLVLLQSLDSDNELENGISIPAAAAAAVSDSINLDSDPAVFASSSALQSVRQKGGIVGAIKTAAAAKAHFLSQGISLLSTDVWVKYDDTTATIIRTSVANAGEYLFGEAVADDPCDINLVCGSKPISKAGVEYGAISLLEFDLRGFKIVGEPAIDTNLQAGLSHLRPNWRIYTDGSELITTDIVIAPRKVEQSSIFGELFHIAKPLKLSSSKEKNKMMTKEVRFSRMENIASGIVGAWVLDKTTIKTQTYLFFSNGIYFMVDPVGDLDREGSASCGSPGVEFASYTYDAATKKLNLKGATFNTNGCVGFSDNDPTTFSVDADGDIATVKMKDGSSHVLHRVSR
ncbi:MAG: adhesin [Nitrosomonadales bacterium]|nr:MAG: adhesin [Nitrosomonadales bacterium]